MDIHAVLTGDIVSSRTIADREHLLETLQEAMQTVTAKIGGSYDNYRGDGFQLQLNSPRAAAWAAVLIRAKLIAQSTSKKERWDARIAIGIGKIEFNRHDVATSDGEAYRLSGDIGMKLLEKNHQRLIISTPWPDSERALSLVTRFADDIISNWSNYSAETTYHYLLDRRSQTQLAEMLDKSQSTINSRLSTAKISLIESYIDHVKDHLNYQIWRKQA